jgi:ATP-dependent Clp protease ATP-binding subunit ClpA
VPVPTRLAVYARRPPQGSILMVPVAFAELAVEEADVATAKDQVESKLRERWAALPAGQRVAMQQVLDATIHRVPVEVTVEGEPVTVTVALVDVSHQAAAGELHIVYAPAVAGFSPLVMQRADPVAKATPRLARLLAKHTTPILLAADDSGVGWLEWVEVDAAPAGAAPAAGAPNPLDEFGERLTGRTAGGQVRRFDLREGLVERVLAVLATPERSSVMLVGPRDVGKTTLVHEIAVRLAEGRVPPALVGRELWRVSANDLIAGARYTGMWQDRGRLLVNYARRTPSIFAMGDPGGILDAGRWSESDNNLGRQLRPYVDAGELTLICECTPEEFGAARNREPSFVNAFQRVDIPEPAPVEAQRILDVVASRLGEALDVAVEPAAISTAFELTRRFEPYRGLPGKAVRLLEETVRSAAADGARAVARANVVGAFTARTGLPLAVISDEVALRPAEVSGFFEARVLGQPDAVGAVTDLLMVLKAALNDPDKPLGTFLFVGPTGVGKTALTMAMAEYLFGSRDRLVRLDMAEYGTADAVQRLAGTTWRRDQEGELTRRVREQPFCVVLLDEIEKAHWSALDALLSVTGEGRLTDAAGRTADFRNAIIVMTSNLGAAREGSAGLGFLAADEHLAPDRVRQHYVEEAERFFRPEFFNRLDRIVVFHPLHPETVRRIARREVGRLLLREGIVRRQLLVEVDDAAVEALTRRGFHPRYGARPLQREVERMVIHPLARLLVEQSPRAGDLVHVHVEGDEIRVELRPVAVPAPSPPRVRQPAERAAPADATLTRALAMAVQVVDAVRAEAEGAFARQLRGDLSGLVDRTNQPDFWDDAGAARTTMSRIYQLQRVLDDLGALQERSVGLAELARRMRAARDRQRVPELRQALADVEARLELLRLELGGAATGGIVSSALVRVTALGPDGDRWAEDVLEMYAAWGDRTTREVARSRRGEPASVRISGLASFELLVAESGLHRRVAADGTAAVVRVTVTRARSDPPPAATAATVVRIYDFGRRQVRDPRTAIQVRDPEAVLREGRIGPFLLAALTPS